MSSSESSLRSCSAEIITCTNSWNELRQLAFTPQLTSLEDADVCPEVVKVVCSTCIYSLLVLSRYKADECPEHV